MLKLIQYRRQFARSISILILTLLLMGCGSVDQTATPDQVGTIVAATLTTVSEKTMTAVIPTITLTVADLQEVLSLTPSLTPSSTPTITPSSTPSVTPTSTQVLINGSSPTPAPDDPVDSLGSPDWKASFLDASNWYTFKTEQSSIQVVEGTLTLTSYKANNYESWSMSYPKISNFYLEMQGVIKDSCEGKDRYGMIFRAPDPNQGILFGITCDGHYRIRTWDGEAYTELIQWKPSEHILSGPNQANRIGVMADGHELTLYINGHKVAELSDDTYNSGVFGAYIASSETPGLIVTITQAAYWTLP